MIRLLKTSLILWLSLILTFIPALTSCNSVPDTSSDAPTDSISIVDDLLITSTTCEIDFPHSIIFEIEAASHYIIEDLELRYKIDKITFVQLVTEVNPDFEAGTQVDTNWTLDTRKISLPPGAQIQYQWLAEDAGGRQVETPWQDILFEDTRYDWQSLTEGGVTLYWYNGNADFGSELTDSAQDTLARLTADTGAELERPVKIFVYANSQDLLGALVYPYEWTGGAAFTEYGIIVADIPPGDLDRGRRVLAHELAHLLFYQMTYNPYNRLPTWLNEGLAMYAVGDLRDDIEALLTVTIAKDELISIQSLSSNFPADPGEALLSYGESYSLVNFLIVTYGSEKIFRLLEEFKDGRSIDTALSSAYGFDLLTLEDLWRESLGLEPLNY